MKPVYNDFQFTKLKFGKYKGYFLKDIPNEYIEWAILNLKDRASAEMFSVEFQRRHKKFR
jgi:hypothetical protein